jgi:bisphosphoglycerate-independent phosphoglycerate mutase (AlkP superfamily)
MNRQFRPGASLLDLAPTILEALGSKATAEMEGESLL